jgi:hypothetical protein
MFQVMIVTALILLSFITFHFAVSVGEGAGVLLQLIAILWFPGAVVLSSLFIPRVAETRYYLYWIFMVTAVVYFIEDAILAFAAPLFGLRFVNFLIFIPRRPCRTNCSGSRRLTRSSSSS